jgi:thymidylate synthase
MTIRKVPFKIILKELFWMLSGSTDNKVLQAQGVHIWDGNTSRQFLDKRGLTEYPEGTLGPGYGWQMRNSGDKYNPDLAEDNKNGIDQLAYVEHLIKNDPDSRRILMNYWIPYDIPHMALAPCHYSVQFRVINNGLYCLFNMRSSDELARSWNAVFYAVLTHILALRCGLTAKELIFNIGDAHIYSSHIEAVKEYIQRKPRPFPCIELDKNLKTMEWHNMTPEHVALVGYFPHPNVKMDMVV